MEMSLVSFDERLGFATMTGKAYVGGRVSEWRIAVPYHFFHHAILSAALFSLFYASYKSYLTHSNDTQVLPY